MIVEEGIPREKCGEEKKADTCPCDHTLVSDLTEAKSKEKKIII